MSHRTSRLHRLIRILPILGLLVAGVAPSALAQSGTPAAEPALLVDDAATENPDLVEVELADPAGLGVATTEGDYAIVGFASGEDPDAPGERAGFYLLERVAR